MSAVHALFLQIQNKKEKGREDAVMTTGVPLGTGGEDKSSSLLVPGAQDCSPTAPATPAPSLHLQVQPPYEDNTISRFQRRPLKRAPPQGDDNGTALSWNSENRLQTTGATTRGQDLLRPEQVRPEQVFPVVDTGGAATTCTPPSRGTRRVHAGGCRHRGGCAPPNAG